MPTRPLIGVTSNVERSPTNPERVRIVLNTTYVDAIFAAGGLPQPLPVPPKFDDVLLDELISRYDGLLFTGGDDLDPANYGQPRHPKTETLEPRRDHFETALFRRADARGVPILAICLGCQVASVTRGGSLVQHVDDVPRAAPLSHCGDGSASAYHPVEIERSSRLAAIIGVEQIEVNSRHHQALDRAAFGDGLRPVAFAPDGVVEAAEDPRKPFFVAVQWHPEDLIDRPEQLRLFEALVEAARVRRANAE
ncbi:MAG: gamma-glutamyl-gamma-aminobutyrate hydrolase family protein [Phycisphaerae bacterium]